MFEHRIDRIQVCRPSDVLGSCDPHGSPRAVPPRPQVGHRRPVGRPQVGHRRPAGRPQVELRGGAPPVPEGVPRAGYREAHIRCTRRVRGGARSNGYSVMVSAESHGLVNERVSHHRVVLWKTLALWKHGGKGESGLSCKLVMRLVVLLEGGSTQQPAESLGGTSPNGPSRNGRNPLPNCTPGTVVLARNGGRKKV